MNCVSSMCKRRNLVRLFVVVNPCLLGLICFRLTARFESAHDPPGNGINDVIASYMGHDLVPMATYRYLKSWLCCKASVCCIS